MVPGCLKEARVFITLLICEAELDLYVDLPGSVRRQACPAGHGSVYLTSTLSLDMKLRSKETLLGEPLKRNVE